ncbi:MAG TPA: hypothetical protein VNT56_10105 [Acidimicrobiales bacterium]|nr:hypothetical protein [Acidimicrobiales bacterium]
MAHVYPSLLSPPVAFARPPTGPDRGEPPARHWKQAIAAGATGLAGEVHVSADGEAVIHDGPALRLGLRRRPIAALASTELPSWLIRLEQLYGWCPAEVHVALDVAEEAVDAVATLARRHPTRAAGRLWLCSSNWRQVATWRQALPGARLVQVSRLRAIPEGPERRAASLAAAGLDAIRLHESDWNAGLTTLFHRFGLLAIAGSTRHRHRLEALVAAGTDGVTSDQVAELVDAVATVGAGSRDPS